MKKAAALSILIAVILLAVAVIAAGRQTKKILRIAILIPVTPAAAAT